MDDQLDIFYNTTNEKGEELKRRFRYASSQTSKIYRFFRVNPGKMFTPPEVMRLMNDPRIRVLNSVRRAMTDLTEGGFLVKTDIKRLGDYGVDNYCWKLKNQIK